MYLSDRVLGSIEVTRHQKRAEHPPMYYFPKTKYFQNKLIKSHRLWLDANGYIWCHTM